MRGRVDDRRRDLLENFVGRLTSECVPERSQSVRNLVQFELLKRPGIPRTCGVVAMAGSHRRENASALSRVIFDEDAQAEFSRAVHGNTLL